jgi:hypothetical protein
MHGAARRGCNPCLSTGAARALLAALLAGPAPRATVPTRYLARLEHSEQGPFGVLTGAWRGLAGVQWGVSGWEACERVIQQGGGGRARSRPAAGVRATPWADGFKASEFYARQEAGVKERGRSEEGPC